MSRDRRSCSAACAAAVGTLLLIVSSSSAQAPGPLNAITDVPGIKVGNFTLGDPNSGTAITGTTVVVYPPGATGGVSQRGGAPGTRETDLLRPENMVEKVNAVTLSGGSAYGLAAADGVMLCLEGQGAGFPVGPGQVVPIVPSAILFDPGRCAPFAVRPNFSFGMAACQAAQTGPVQQGNVGAGAGARSGGVKGGLGTASTILTTGAGNGIIIGAIVAVNSSGRTFDNNGNLFAEFLELGNEFPLVAPTGTDVVPPSNLLQNTTIAVIATNATLTKAQATKVAQMADDGLARAIKPSHGVGDGDTIFVMATGADGRDATNLVNTIGSNAADTLSRAVVHAILAAQSINSSACVVKSYCDTFPGKCAK